MVDGDGVPVEALGGEGDVPPHRRRGGRDRECGGGQVALVMADAARHLVVRVSKG